MKLTQLMKEAKSKAQMGGGFNTIIWVVVLILVALALFPTIINQTTNASLYPGASSTILTILGLVPIFYAVGVLSIAGLMIYIGYFRGK